MSPVPDREIPAVVCKGLSKRFGDVQALRGLTLLIPKGQTFGVLGPTGAGKTTTIRVWLGLTPPDEGVAFVLGRRIPPRAVLPRIGYMPQDPAVYPDLTVDENLALFGRLVGMDAERIEDRTEAVLDLLDIASRRHDLLADLSGGLRRRASLAAALLHDPDLLLLDEPTAGADPELRATVWTHFGELTRRKKTVVITTHSMEEASRCDHVALLYQGRLLAHGPPQWIQDRTRAWSLEDAFRAFLRAAGEPTP